MFDFDALDEAVEQVGVAASDDHDINKSRTSTIRGDDGHENYKDIKNNTTTVRQRHVDEMTTIMEAPCREYNADDEVDSRNETKMTVKTGSCLDHLVPAVPDAVAITADETQKTHQLARSEQQAVEAAAPAPVAAAFPSTLQVQFATLGKGVVAELQLSQNVTAAEVKSMLLSHIKIPVEEQRLLVSTTIWEDGCPLRSICQGLHASHDVSVEITVVRMPIAAFVALSGSRNGTLRIWDIDRGSLLRELKGNPVAVNCVALNWAAQFALSGGEDRKVCRWDLAEGKVIQEFEGHEAAVNCLALAWDEGKAVSGSSDHTLRVWHLERGKSKRTLVGHTGPVNCVDLDNTAKRVISGSEDKSVRIWNLDTGEVVQQCHGHFSPVHCVSLDAGSKNAATGGWGTLKLWKLGVRPVARSNPMMIHIGQRGSEDGFKIADLKGHTGPITCVSIDWETRRGLTGSADSTLCVWSPDLRTTAGFRLRPSVLYKHSLPITCLTVDWSSDCAISGGGDCLWVWDLKQGRAVRPMRGPEERGDVLCVAMDRRQEG